MRVEPAAPELPIAEALQPAMIDSTKIAAIAPIGIAAERS
jgi:hypothetical protein